MTFADILTIIGAIFFYGIYVHYKSKKVEEAKKQEELERKANSEKFRLEYETKQRAAVKEKKSHQVRPDDWDVRKSFVLERDGYKCVKCGSYENLHVHHKVPVSIKPDHSEDNLITLCIHCHSEQDGIGHNGLVARSIGKQCSKYYFKKVKGRKEHKCDNCETTICKGQHSYIKNYWYRNIQYSSNKIPDNTIRICEDCLLSFNDYTYKTMR